MQIKYLVYQDLLFIFRLLSSRRVEIYHYYFEKKNSRSISPIDRTLENLRSRSRTSIAKQATPFYNTRHVRWIAFSVCANSETCNGQYIFLKKSASAPSGCYAGQVSEMDAKKSSVKLASKKDLMAILLFLEERLPHSYDVCKRINLKAFTYELNFHSFINLNHWKLKPLYQSAMSSAPMEKFYFTRGSGGIFIAIFALRMDTALTTPVLWT